MFLSAESNSLIRQEQFKDWQSEAMYQQLLRESGLRQTIKPATDWQMVDRYGVQLIKWGAKLQYSNALTKVDL